MKFGPPKKSAKFSSICSELTRYARDQSDVVLLNPQAYGLIVKAVDEGQLDRPARGDGADQVRFQAEKILEASDRNVPARENHPAQKPASPPRTDSPLFFALPFAVAPDLHQVAACYLAPAAASVPAGVQIHPPAVLVPANLETGDVSLSDCLDE